MTSLFSKIGSKFGTCVDSFMSKSGFGSLADELKKIDEVFVPPVTSTSTFTAIPSNCENLPTLQQTMDCVNKTSSFSAVEGETTTEEDQKQKIKELEAKTKDYIAKDASLSWAGGNNERMKRVRWTNQMVPENATNTPISYKDAILEQPMPMLSPLRGTNQPQGIRAIADADAGRSTQYYDPTKAIGVAIPANIGAGGLDYTQKATIAGKEDKTGTASEVSSTFMSKFM
jgi:hypothetical protein